jgi:hypothetical protein
MTKKWQKANLTWDKFCDMELNQPGVLVEVEWYDSKKKQITRTFLIGDINELRGVCDDCTAFPKDSEVIRYKVLLEKKW